jgi:hypothetical protein
MLPFTQLTPVTTSMLLHEDELPLVDDPLVDDPLVDDPLDDDPLDDDPLDDEEELLLEYDDPLEPDDPLDDDPLPQSHERTCSTLQKRSSDEVCDSLTASTIEPTGSAKSMPRCLTRLKTRTLFDTSNNSTD